MGMGLKLRSGLIANDRSCFGNLVAYALKHPPLNPGCGAGNPRQIMVVNHNPLAVISVDIH
jgi:hypothetical protein